VFWGNYSANHAKLAEMHYAILKLPKPILTKLNNDQGFGQIKGITQKKGVVYPKVEISVFKRSDKTLLWTTQSRADGSYQVRNIAKGLECFIVAFDPKEKYNAVISDKVVAK